MLGRYDSHCAVKTGTVYCYLVYVVLVKNANYSYIILNILKLFPRLFQNNSRIASAIKIQKLFPHNSRMPSLLDVIDYVPTYISGRTVYLEKIYFNGT